eukprot:TRINITY_DN23425_c0_g1_i1.p1 TRINITY_DN23425_c0_g1~~TRINITY_DN23425_c0_g1_i1.p1  ORF type:complete len:259 (+),score=46.92 TRINITY_DN23425_c0_g1_i1:37-813(+)
MPPKKRGRVDTAEEENFVLPIVVGSVARELKPGQKKTDPRNLFEWVVYLRGIGHAPLGHVVSKVKIFLHPEMKEPVRTITEEPFETYDQGWGTFELTFKVFFREKIFGEELSVNIINHNLVLVPVPVAKHNVPGNGGNSLKYTGRIATSGSRPVAVERVDEIVVSSPPRSLPSPPPRLVIPLGPPHWKIWPDIEKHRPEWMIRESHQLERLQEISEGLNGEIDRLKEKHHELMWQKAAALQRLSYIKSNLKNRKKKKS